MFFVPSWSSNAFIFYRIQALCLSVSNYRTSRTMNISLRLCSSEQTNGSTSTKNKTVVYSLIVRLSVHVNLLFLLFRNPLLLQRYNSKHWVTKIRSLWRYAESTKFINTGTFTHRCSWPRKISISVKNKLSHSTSTEVITSTLLFYLYVIEADHCTPDSFQESTDPYVLYIDSHLSLKAMTVRNITKEILGVKG